MESKDLNEKITRIAKKYRFIKALVVADKADGVGKFEYKSSDEEIQKIFQNHTIGISIILLTFADIFKQILEHINNLRMGNNKSVIIHYDKFTVVKK